MQVKGGGGGGKVKVKEYHQKENHCNKLGGGGIRKRTSEGK